MSGCERNYDFGDLINCASGLNRLAALEFGKENLQLGGKHVKQETIWSKLHPRPVGQCEPDLASFAMLESDSEVVEALKTGLKEAQGCLIRLNMAPHNRVRDQTWWKTPWVKEKELQMFGKSQPNEDTEEDLEDRFGEDGSGSLSSDLWDVTTPVGDHVGLSGEDAEDDLPFVGHETRHVMTEVLNEVLSTEPTSKVDPMVSHEGHPVYKASLVSLLVGNPTLSKDRLSRIKQTIFFNGVKPKARVPGVPVCILDVGSDCAVLFDHAGEGTTTRGRRVLPAIAWSRLKFRYEGTDLQWIDIESVISVVTMKVENGIRPTWSLDASDREKVDQFVSTT
ncbi:hypothetical protein R1sor_021619 [Riccia sorocarpa]|uniref:Guanylate cyclase domain-containing protein n=1 Tax=Riccia sorocarpa TaxID=122646 RepID=A0ABD3GHL3_9MARC